MKWYNAVMVRRIFGNSFIRLLIVSLSAVAFCWAAEAGLFRWKQYMQNVAAPLVEARVTARAYEAVDMLNAPRRFLIPVFREMPSEPSPDPAKGLSVLSPSR